MAENLQQKSVGKNNGRTGVFGQFATKRKKVITASCLLMIMVIMWARIFIGKKPDSAKGAAGNPAVPLAADATDINAAARQLKIRFIELPKVKGRNDVITRDIFSINKIERISKNSQGNQSAGTAAQEELAEQIYGMLKLEAIGVSDRKQAFINNKLLSEGDKLTVDSGGTKYECEVVKILETEVYIKCQGVEIRLKLTNPNEVIDG